MAATRSFWSPLPSLYLGLSDQTVENLEKVFEYQFQGYYDAALRLVDEALPPACYCPVVAVAHIGLLESLNRYEECMTVAWDTLSALYRGLCIAPAGVKWLLSLRLCHSRLFFDGDLRTGLDIARQLRSRLLEDDPAAYDEIILECVTYYHVLVAMASTISNWCTPDDGDLPPTLGKNSKASCHILRQLAISAGNPVRAIRWAIGEATLSSGLTKLELYQEYLSWCSGLDVSGNRPLRYWIWTLKFNFVKELAALHKNDEAAKVLKSVRSEVSYFAHSQGTRIAPSTQLRLGACRYEVDNPVDNEQTVSRCLELYRLAKGFGNVDELRRWLAQAYWTGVRLSNMSGSDARSGRDLDSMLYELADLSLSIYPAAWHAALILCKIGVQLHLQKRSGEFLEYFKSFSESWPDFNVPVQQFSLLNLASMAAADIGDQRQQQMLMLKASEVVSQFPTALQERTQVRDDVENPTGVNIDPFADDMFWQDLVQVGNLRSESQDTRWDTLERIYKSWAVRICRCLQDDLRKGLIDEQTAKEIVPIDAMNDLDLNDLANAYLELDGNLAARTIFGEPGKRRPGAAWNDWWSKFERWLLKYDSVNVPLYRQKLLMQVARFRSQSVFDVRENSPHDTAEHMTESLIWAEEVLRIAECVDPRVGGREAILGAKRNIASCQIRLANDALPKFPGPRNVELLNKAFNTLSELLENHKADSHLENVFFTLVSLARCCLAKSQTFGVGTPNASLVHLEEAEDTYRQMAMGASILPSFGSYSAKTSLAERLMYSQHLEMGMFAALLAWAKYVSGPAADLQSPEQRALLTDMIVWSQKSKARSLTDLLGLGLSGQRFPQNVIQMAQSSSRAMELLQHHDQLSARLSTATIGQRVNIHNELQALTKEMRNLKELIPLMDIREGKTVGPIEIYQMGEGVVFVDWLHVPDFTDWDIGLVVYKNGAFHHFHPIPELKLRDVEKWVSKHLEPDWRLYDEDDGHKFQALSGRTASTQLNQLAPLVAPLEKLTQPSETLVFSPTKALYRLPLHALEVAGQVLIERNPITYCQSLTILRFCMTSRAQLWRARDDAVHRVVINPLRAAKDVAKTVDDIAVQLGTEVRPEAEDPKQQFVDWTSKAAIIHFHGHVRFDEKDPRKHHLELVEHPEGQPSDIDLPPHQMLTAEDVFGMHLIPGTHLTTISCKSARAEISKANDQLGLMTAFHIAGVSSTISALWNIHRADGARFSETFYKELLADLGSPTSGSKVVNMARAMQKAVLACQTDAKGPRPPYHWAGLIFSGAWLFPRPSTASV